MKSAKVNQSKIGLKNDGAIQLEPKRIANIVKDFYSDLAGNLVRKLSAELNRFNNNSKKQYYLNIEKNCHNFKLCNEILETIKKKLADLDASKAPVISSKFLIDGTEILALPLLLPVASKIIEKTIQIQTQEYLDKYGLLYIYQSGFHANFQRILALYNLWI